MSAPILPITPEHIKRAATCLKSGELVSFPTETVYGLGALASDARAVAAIYAAKERPSFNPLIAHYANEQMLAGDVELTKSARQLMQAFWPGPLTLVLKRTETCQVAALASAGLDSLAVRMPSHPDARALITETGGPIVAPSANLSGRLSPTIAEHVAEQLKDRISLILDGGPCADGLESTILDMRGDTAILLRPGPVTAEDIEQVTGFAIEPYATSSDEAEASLSPVAPGQLTSHYAPEATLRLNATSKQEGETYIGFGPSIADADFQLSDNGDLTEAAARLFDILHQADLCGQPIAIAPITAQGLGLAINDRLKRAAAPRDADIKKLK